MRLGVAGAGRWGHAILRVLADITLNSPVQVRVFDPVLAGPVFGEAEVVGSYQDLLDASTHVVIATPPPMHAGMVAQAVAAGVESVFVEKPLATSMREARLVAGYAEEKQVRIAVGHALVTETPGFGQFREQVPEHVEVFRLGGLPGHHGLSAWWDLGVHDVAVCVDLLGSPARADIATGPDWYHGLLQWPEGRTARLTGVREAGLKRWTITVDGHTYSPYSEVEEPLRNELEWWLAGGENLDDAVRVVEVLEQA